MFTATLISAAKLDAELPALLSNDLGGSAPRWLAPGTAAEFDLPARPEDEDAIWASLQRQGIDLALQPSGNRRKRILIADMDSTMIQQECIDELADLAGVGPRVAAITARAMNGELNFREALIERVTLLAGLPASTIAEVMAHRITLAPGGRALLATMRAHGAHTALVSGGFTAFTQMVSDQLGFHEHRANSLEIVEDTLTGHVIPPILGREAKVEALEEIAARLGTTPADAIAVGDGANDLGMIQLAGTGVALHAKPAVAAQAPIRINHGDLTALLYLQGYHADEFAA